MKLFKMAALFVAALLFTAPAAIGQSYPFQTPSYTPTAQLAASVLTATGDYYFNANGAGASVRVSALSGTLVATIQGSNDPLTVANASATWTTLYYLDASSPSTAPANGISANGLYVFNAGGFTRFRVHVTTLSGGSHTVTLGAALTPGASALYVLNPSSSAASAPPPTTSLPYGAVAKTASATGTTGATTATLTPSSGKTIWLCGFSIRANATAAATGDATVTGVISGTLHYTQWTAPLASGIGVIDPSIGAPCIPASAADQAVAIVSAAPGSGGVVSVSAWGYEK